MTKEALEEFNIKVGAVPNGALQKNVIGYVLILRKDNSLFKPVIYRTAAKAKSSNLPYPYAPPNSTFDEYKSYREKLFDELYKVKPVKLGK